MNNWEKSIALHGHACCLLAVGYRAAETALAELTRVGVDIGDLAAVVENQTCGVDAVQVVCQATPANGRLLVLDRGPGWHFLDISHKERQQDLNGNAS